MEHCNGTMEEHISSNRDNIGDSMTEDLQLTDPPNPFQDPQDPGGLDALRQDLSTMMKRRLMYFLTMPM